KAAISAASKSLKRLPCLVCRKRRSCATGGSPRRGSPNRSSAHADMQAARWERVQELFHRAIDLAPDEQPAFLHGACAGDETLVRDVLAMLAHDSRSTSLLDSDVAQAADTVIGGAVSAPLAEQAFGPYRLVRPLGEGGMGVVYLATRDDLGSWAAIKILRDAWISPRR